MTEIILYGDRVPKKEPNRLGRYTWDMLRRDKLPSSDKHHRNLSWEEIGDGDRWRCVKKSIQFNIVEQAHKLPSGGTVIHCTVDVHNYYNASPSEKCFLLKDGSFDRILHPRENRMVFDIHWDAMHYIDKNFNP